MEANVECCLSVLRRLLDQMLQWPPRIPAMGPFPQRREYLDCLIAYATVRRVQEQRRQAAAVDSDPEWPLGLARQLQRQAGALGAAQPESRYLGVELPPLLSGEEWTKKYKDKFLHCTPLGQNRHQQEE